MNNKEKRYQCPCCGYFTILTAGEIVTEICEVCFWHYDSISQKYPEKAIGPNKVSLETARKNYMEYGAIEKRFVCYVSPPLPEELPENNIGNNSISFEAG